MAKSEIIDRVKRNIIKGIIEDEDIVTVIDSPDKDKQNFDGYCITYTPQNEKDGWIPLLFPFLKYPDTIEDVITWVGLKCDIAGDYNYDKNWKKIQLEIDLFSHIDHMRIDNIPQITANRLDYLSCLVEDLVMDKLSNYLDCELYSNYENAYDTKFMVRKMIFIFAIPKEELC